MRIIDRRAHMEFKLKQRNRIVSNVETVQNSNILLASYIKKAKDKGREK